MSKMPIRRLIPGFAGGIAILSLAACGGPSTPRSFPPMTYDYLPQIRLNEPKLMRRSRPRAICAPGTAFALPCWARTAA